MEKFTLNKRLLSVLVLIIATLALLVYARMESISVAHNENETLTEVNLNTYVNYDEAWGKGTILQYDVKTGIEYGEDKEQSPIKNTTLMAVAPQINGVYPDRATVVSKSTKSTNGKEVNSEINYSYDATVGTVTVQASNENQDGTAINGTTDQNARDEYVVIFNYGEAAYDGTNSPKEIDMQLSVIQNLFADENNIAQSSDTFKSTVSENIGGFATVDETSSDIYNGNIKSNVINETDYATTFTENDEISIANKDAQDKLTTTITPTFVREYQDRNGETKQQDLGNNGGVVYKSTKVQKDDIQNVLGADGSVDILDSDGNVLATINRDTQYAEDGTFTIEYETEPQAIIVKANNIINEGQIRLENTEEIKPVMRDIDNIKIKVSSEIIGINTETVTVEPEQVEPKQEAKEADEAVTENAQNAIQAQPETKEVETQSYTVKNEAQTEIKQAQTNVGIDINNLDWTNEKQNEVEFDITLNAISEKDNMFKNPIVRIELPNEVEKVVLGESSILYANGLELAKVTSETNENGNLVIVATMQGTQTVYNNNELGLSTTIKVPASVILKKDIETKVTNINIAYTNEYTVEKTPESGNLTKEVKVNNYQEDLAGEQEKQATQDAIYAEAEQTQGQDITQDQTNQNEQTAALEDNINNDLKLEVAPTKGDTVLKNGDVVYEGEFIKYNIKVTNTSNSDINNLKIKATIPEGTTYGELQADYYNYRGQYKYNYEDQTREKEINIGNVKSGESNTVFYEVKVNNLADDETEKNIDTNITLYAGDQEGQTFNTSFKIQQTKESSFLGAMIDYGDNYFYWLNLYSDEDKEVTVKLHFPEEFTMNEITQSETTIEDPTTLIPGQYKSTVLYEEDRNIKNIEFDKSTDNVITLKLQTNKSYSFGGDVKIDSSNVKKAISQTTAELTAYMEVEDGEKNYISNENRFDMRYNAIETVMTSDREGEELREGEEVNYQIKISNVGGKNVKTNDGYPDYIVVNVADVLPNDIDPKTITYDNWKVVGEDGNMSMQKTENITEELLGPNIDIRIILPEGESTTIYVKALAGLVYEKTKIENKATTSGDNLESKTTNTVEHTILPYNYDLPDDDENKDNPVDPNEDIDGDDDDTKNQTTNNTIVNPNTNNTNIDNTSKDNENTQNIENQNEETKNNNEQNTDGKNTISGVAWIDANSNGKRDSDEQLLSGVNVMLLDMQNSNKALAQTTTSNEGTYSFTGIKNGNYLVAFKYDTSKYRLTEYQKNGVDAKENSDATTQAINIDGTQETVGLTDTIANSASNIDIGVIENSLCDIKIDKYISKVTVKTNKGTKDYNYNNKNMAKVEIRAKEIEGATVVINYKLVVTNVGEVSARVGKVIDILPQGLDFSSNINKSWIKGNDGTLTNTSLSNKMLNAGESTELSLIATKQMTESSTGLFTNKAELQNIVNSENIKDSKGDNDSSKADVILSISTGAMLYITLAIVILGILIILLYILNKKGKIHIHFDKNNFRFFEKFKIKNIKLPKKKTILKILVLCVAVAGVMFAAIPNNNVVEAAGKTYWKTPDTDKHGIWSNADFEVYRDSWYTKLRAYDEPHSCSWYELHHFEVSGPLWNETGLCENHRKDAWGGTGYPGSFNFYYQDGDSTTSNTFTFERNGKGSSGDPIDMKIDGDYCVYGPISFTLSGDPDELHYNRVVVDGNGKVLNAEWSGDKLKGTGTKEMYFKIKKEDAKAGISNIEIQASGIVTTVDTDIYAVDATLYPSDSDDQPVGVSRKSSAREETTIIKKEVVKHLTWYARGTVIIDKVDYFHPETKLDKVEINLKGGNYDKTKVTDTNGEVLFENRKPNSYTATEGNNPHYGYTVPNVSKTFTLKYGQYKEVTLKNKKQTGTLELTKVDSETNAPLDRMRFKIKSPNGYVAVSKTDYLYTGVWDPLKEVTGDIDIGSMKDDLPEDQATIFITDANGRIRISNMLSNKYNYKDAGDDISERLYTVEELYEDTANKTTAHYGYTKLPEPLSVRVKMSTENEAVAKYTYPNVKQTGNLKILKVDQDNDKKSLDKMKFRIKSPKGGYVTVSDTDYLYTGEWIPRKEVTGKYEIGSMKDDQTKEDATVFITGDDGVLEILNMLSCDYNYNGQPYVLEEIYDNEPNKTTKHYGYTKLPEPIEAVVPTGKTAYVEKTFKNEKQTGNLKIVKTDADSGAPLKGMKFRLKSPKGGYITVSDTDYLYTGEWIPRKEVTGKYVVGSMKDDQSKEDATIFITGDDGIIEINNLLTSTFNYNNKPYELEEVAVNGDDYYGYTVKADNTLIDSEYIEWSSGTSGKQNLVDKKMEVVINRQKSMDTEKTESGTGEQLSVFNKKKFIKLTGNVWEDLANLQKNEEGDDVLGGDKPIENIKVTLKNSDGSDVQMAKIDSAIASDESQKSTFTNPTYTAADGTYYFDDVLIGGNVHQREVKGAKYYYIQFEYDGEVYTSVRSFEDLGMDNSSAIATTSKAVEIPSGELSREAVDNSFSEVKGVGNGEEYIDYSNINGFQEHYTLTEASGENEAKAISKNKELFDSQGTGGSRNVNQFSGYENYDGVTKTAATTKETGYGVLGSFETDGSPSTNLRNGKISEGVETTETIRTEGIEELAQRNYGTKEREKVNLAISNDIDNVEVRVNGYKHNYRYAKGAYDRVEAASDDDEDAYQYKNFRLDCKMKNKFGYVRPLYAEDIVYDGNDTCQVYIVYKVTVANISNSLTAKVTDLSEYHDSRNKVCGVKLESEGNNGIFENGTELTGTDIPGTGYTATHINNLSSVEIPAGSSAALYVKFHVDPKAVSSVLQGDMEMSNVVEINGFTTYYSDKTYYHTGVGSKAGSLYAGIDRNSAPGNAKIEFNGNKLNVRTYEDDTSIAPTITLTLREGYRTIKGTVFEDSTTTGDGKTKSTELKKKDENNGATYTSADSVDTGKERIGDGIYTPGKENTVGNVKVELLYYDNGAVSSAPATLYTYSNGTNQKTPATMETSVGGEYEFAGIVPDEYMLRFTYSNGSVIYKAGKTDESENVDPDYYKATIIKSNIIKDALNNNTIVGDGSAATLSTTSEPYDSKKWHILSEYEDGSYKAENSDKSVRYSDAMDTNKTVGEAIDPTYKINNDAYTDGNYTGEKGHEGSHYSQKEAYTGIMNIQIELDNNEPDAPAGGTDYDTTTDIVNNSDGTYKVVDENVRVLIQNVDFGIVQKARHAYDLNKEVSNIKITLAGGQVLISGDPTKDTIEYLKYLPQNDQRYTRISMEIDNELLIGAKLEITYKLEAKNLSETNYLTEGYYRYGEDKTNMETITFSKIFDYLDDDLTYDGVQTNDNRVTVLGKIGDNKNDIIGTEENALKYISKDFIDKIKSSYEVILMLNSNQPLAPNESDSWSIIASKVLTTNDDMDYTNSAEVTEITTTNTPSKFSKTGNHDPSYEPGDTSKNIEEDNFKSEVTINSPTGADKSYTVYIIGAIALIVLGSGIIIIKRKVL